MKPAKPKEAVLLIETVSVLCPVCDEVIPDPEHGSEFWTKDQMGAYPETQCGFCDLDVVIGKQIRVAAKL